MTMPLIDLIVLALLAGTVAYAALVDRRVRALMAALEALRPTVDALSEVTDRTEGSVTALRDAAAGIASAAAPPDAACREGHAEPPAAQVRPAATVDGKADLIGRFFEDARGRSA